MTTPKPSVPASATPLRKRSRPWPRSSRTTWPDHADALVEAGWDPEEAQAHALDAMGEAKEVGQALDQTFPRRWLVLSRVNLVLAILVALVLFFPLTSRVEGAVNNLIARTDPFDSPNHMRSGSIPLEDFSPWISASPCPMGM